MPRRWDAAAPLSRALRGGADQLVRRRLARRGQLRWWLIYGPVRSGTTYMMRSIAANARLQVGDWGLRFALGLPPDLPHVQFDRERARTDVSRNVLLNAPSGGGRAIDLVYKSAQLRPEEHSALLAMWGVPERTIFCVREPSGYMASAVRKFPEVDVDAFRVEYLRDIEAYDTIGGEVFVYSPGLTTEAYQSFLAPLTVPPDDSYSFVYQGSTADELVSEEMRQAFQALLQRAAVQPPGSP